MPKVMAALPNIGGALCVAKFGWRPLLQCLAVTLQRCETRWNSLECPKIPNPSQPLVGWSSSYCGDMCRTYCCLRSFFLIVDTCLSCEGTARQIMQWWRDGNFCVLYFQQAASSTFQTCILNSQYGHAMCRSMADIQSVAKRLGKEKKKDGRTKPQGQNIMAFSIT